MKEVEFYEFPLSGLIAKDGDFMTHDSDCNGNACILLVLIIQVKLFLYHTFKVDISPIFPLAAEGQTTNNKTSLNQ